MIMNRTSLANLVPLLLVALLLEGCSHSPTMEAPSGFLALRGPEGEFKATNTDDDRIWIREFVDANQGPLSFWIEALTKDFSKNRGYELLDQGEVRDAEGRSGEYRRFKAQVDGVAYGYFVAVFVEEHSSHHLIRTVEMIAGSERFEEQSLDLIRSLRTLES